MGKGLGASPGAACGKIVFSAEDAVEWAARGEKVVLVRLETSPEDITGMKSAQGILTVRGGMTSHAAVVARGMGTCCVSGCGDIKMDEANKKFELAGKTFVEGDYISIDGSTGNIYDGIIPTVDAQIAGEFGRVMEWADKYRRLKVRTNADTPTDAKKARELGAEGIGERLLLIRFFRISRATSRSSMRLLKVTRLQSVSLIRRFMSSFRLRKLTSRLLQMHRASPLRTSRLSSALSMSSTR